MERVWWEEGSGTRDWVMERWNIIRRHIHEPWHVRFEANSIKLDFYSSGFSSRGLLIHYIRNWNYVENVLLSYQIYLSFFHRENLFYWTRCGFFSIASVDIPCGGFSVLIESRKICRSGRAWIIDWDISEKKERSPRNKFSLFFIQIFFREYFLFCSFGFDCLVGRRNVRWRFALLSGSGFEDFIQG